jgi:hypothetical protein
MSPDASRPYSPDEALTVRLLAEATHGVHALIARGVASAEARAVLVRAALYLLAYAFTSGAGRRVVGDLARGLPRRPGPAMTARWSTKQAKR